MSEKNPQTPDDARPPGGRSTSIAAAAGVEWVPAEPAPAVVQGSLFAAPVRCRPRPTPASRAPPGRSPCWHRRSRNARALPGQAGQHRRDTQTVFGVGPVDPELCFVGEAPGRDEDAQGEPFVGAAGQLLTRIIVAMGMKREEVYICNILRCRPPGNRPPEAEEAANCSEWPREDAGTGAAEVHLRDGQHAAEVPARGVQGRHHQAARPVLRLGAAPR